MSKHHHATKEAGKKRAGKFKTKLRIAIYNDTSYEQIWSLRMMGGNALVAAGVGLVVIISLTIVLIAFTPLREFIPGYPDETTRKTIVQNTLRTDSLERVIARWDKQLTNIRLIMSGEAPLPIETGVAADTVVQTGETFYVNSKEDSLFRLEVEKEDQYKIYPEVQAISSAVRLEKLHFFPPVKGGVVSGKFDAKSGHYAIDLVTVPNSVVSSVMDGTVVMANWTSDTGWVIQIQHDGDIISVYKHNAKLLKKVAEHVKAGGAIAVAGNSGELTTGPHLHFELWYRGAPVDPAKYIIF
jgi:murein DD-endopeptidase MepM/ murein hydrolase activator NlpD